MDSQYLFRHLGKLIIKLSGKMMFIYAYMSFFIYLLFFQLIIANYVHIKIYSDTCLHEVLNYTHHINKAEIKTQVQMRLNTIGSHLIFNKKLNFYSLPRNISKNLR